MGGIKEARNRTTPESVHSGGYGPYLRGRWRDSGGVPEMRNSIANAPGKSVRSTLQPPITVVFLQWLLSDAACLCLSHIPINVSASWRTPCSEKLGAKTRDHQSPCMGCARISCAEHGRI